MRQKQGNRFLISSAALPELVEAGDLLRREGPGLLVVLLRDDEAILVYEVDFTTRHSGERTTMTHQDWVTANKTI